MLFIISWKKEYDCTFRSLFCPICGTQILTNPFETHCVTLITASHSESLLFIIRCGDSAKKIKIQTLLVWFLPAWLF